MYATRMLAVGMIVCVLGAVAHADEKKDTAKKDYAKLLLGKWEATKAAEGTLPVGAVVEFTKDGKLKMTFKMGDQEVNFDATYKVEGNKFTMTMKMGDVEMSHTITINKITDT